MIDGASQSLTLYDALIDLFFVHVAESVFGGMYSVSRLPTLVLQEMSV